MKRPKFIQDMFNLIRFTAFKIRPEAILKIEFKRHAGYKLNVKNPQTFNEKLQWLKLNWYDPNATICADKYSVRKFVEDRGLGHLLNDLYGVYDNVDDINIDSLPSEFVMKVTHGCGQNLICTDKSKFNWGTEKKMFNKWLKISHYYDSLEWVYRDIKPRIIVEKLIKTNDEKCPKDYKIFCFNGEPKCLFVATDRGEHTTKFDFYDLEWNHLTVKNHYPNSGEILIRPKELNEILEYSKILSKGFPHVRVDFYIENNKVIFGECTFFHFSGSEPYEPMKFDYEMGKYLKLPKKKATI
ncbi:ATP-grasp fold amidoligase family protein [Vallitalea sediminicola]